MGTPLAEVIDSIGGGPITRRTVAVMSGVSNPLLTADHLDTPLSYEAMVDAGSGLGAAGFIVFDQSSDLVAVAQGVARFLAVESCGQCTPCKQDGLAIADRLDHLRRNDAGPEAVTELEDRLATVADGARCFLATQQQLVVGSVLSSFGEAVAAHAEGSAETAEAELIAAIVDIVDDEAVLDTDHRTKQPDWTHDPEDSGRAPADSGL
ncbi:MAG: NADH-ubiquinone oxidoreductase-F iron-sulfur binding region domain-containing protein [Acidimicrobiales bacterium]